MLKRGKVLRDRKFGQEESDEGACVKSRNDWAIIIPPKNPILVFFLVLFESHPLNSEGCILTMSFFSSMKNPLG